MRFCGTISNTKSHETAKESSLKSVNCTIVLQINENEVTYILMNILLNFNKTNRSSRSDRVLT